MTEKPYSYPVPDVQPNKRNYQESCWPRILTSDDNDADHCNIHGHHKVEKQRDEYINIGLISGCLCKLKKKKVIIRIYLKQDSNVRAYIYVTLNILYLD